MIIAKTKRIGNGSLLNSIVDSDDISGNTWQLDDFSFNLYSENICFKKFPGNSLKNKHELLHNLDGFKLRSRTTIQPIFNRRLCGGMTDITKEFKNSVGKFMVLFSPPIVSIDSKGIRPPGNNSISGS
ncbi:hypothetical protein TNCV_5044911 [Trichonephila clavipes]|uniref:Uncharacterized protein n=1 Tax=Trichonephila clavipes TaxID=2585209 RepID=A0A8X7BKB7_TRICX|nr:hypothetical protein TNCV_5044911 [Trichonephila clavipes]